MIFYYFTVRHLQETIEFIERRLQYLKKFPMLCECKIELCSLCVNLEKYRKKYIKKDV